MKVLFRTDSAAHIGLGHVSRCMTLAEEFENRGHTVHILCRKHYGYVQIPENPNRAAFYLPGGLGKSKSRKVACYGDWLGVSAAEESVLITDHIAQHGPYDIIVIDHYAIDGYVESRIGSDCYLIAIDDLMNRNHHCDLLIDQNLSAERQVYQSLQLKKECDYLLGPKYAILKRGFRDIRKVRMPETVNNVVVFFGLRDVTNESKKVLDAAISISPDVCFIFVLNKENEFYKEIDRQTRHNDKIKLYDFVDDMPGLLDQVDVSFGATGVSVWERAAAGVPSFVVTTSENQRSVISSLLENGLVNFVGDGLKTDVNSWKNAILSLSDTGFLKKLFERGQKVCDGLGVFRILEHVEKKAGN